MVEECLSVRIDDSRICYVQTPEPRAAIQDYVRVF